MSFRTASSKLMSYIYHQAGGAIPGNHRVIFDSEVDTIVLEHNARSRCGFAEGAVRAAEWIYGRSGLYDINDFMNSIIGGVDDQ